jgi:hypothetical protein
VGGYGIEQIALEYGIVLRRHGNDDDRNSEPCDLLIEVAQPFAAGLDEFSSRNCRGMANDSDQVALAARSHPQDAKAVRTTRPAKTSVLLSAVCFKRSLLFDLRLARTPARRWRSRRS